MTGTQVHVIRVTGPLATDDSFLTSASYLQVHEYIHKFALLGIKLS